MSDILTDIQEQIYIISLNRVDKHNAFDEQLLATLQAALDTAIADSRIRIIILKANGNYFSAGADIAWMQRMSKFNETENVEDAMKLARLMHTLHTSPKPTLAMVQGPAYGGGVGLIAACDLAIAAQHAHFCFSEVKLGLIPAVISPYVIRAIGERAATWLFMSAETIDAAHAKQLQLVQFCVPAEELWDFSLNYAQKMARLAPEAMRASKGLVAQVAHQPIDETLLQHTANLIAKKRLSAEGQQGLLAFLNKELPHWN